MIILRVCLVYAPVIYIQSLYQLPSSKRERERGMASITMAPVLTSPRDDAIQLHRAFKGLGCDTATVVNLLAHRNSAQRALIAQEYKHMYHEELQKRLASELRGDVEKAVLLWMPDPATRDAIILQQLLHQRDIIWVTHVIEVICSRTPSQLQQIRQIYHAITGVSLQDALQTIDSNADSVNLLRAYERTPRYEGFEVDRAMVEKDAKALFKAGEKKLGTDEDVFIRIFCERSRAHLSAVSSAYKHMYGKLEKAIKKETSGDFEFALLTILRCAENPGKFFAKELYKSMKGLGTEDSKLIRIITSRAEIDMQYIKAEYHKKYGKSLNDAVHSETSGHYRTFLLALLGPSH